MSRWVRHKEKWSVCQRCELCDTRSSVVLARGNLPADILFVGEAPGRGEDVLGKPFIGPAGKLLDRIIANSLPPRAKKAFTNLISCIPLDVDGNKVNEPDKQHVYACADRLNELVKLANPAVIVMVGKLSAKWVPKVVLGELLDNVLTTQITHPAAILRANVSQKGLAVQQTAVALSTVWEDVVPF